MSKLNADTITSPSITDVIYSIKEEDKTEFIVQKGKLVYIGKDEEKIKWCRDLGITCTNYELTEEEYNEIYKDEIEIALKYGEVVDGVYRLKDEYNFDTGLNPQSLPEEAKVIAVPYGVTKLSDYAFGRQSTITNVILPDTVTSIGAHAFRITSITSIDLPKNLTSIDNCAFSGTNITTINLPESLTSLGEEVFYSCKLLTSITIPNKITNLGVESFSGCTSLTTVVLPEGLKSIAYSTFSGCKSLNNLIIPNSVETISHNAFNGANIKMLKMPTSITTIDGYIFEMANIEKIVIPKTVTSIDDYAFDASTIGTVYYEGTEAEWSNISISEVGNTSLLNATKVYNYAG